MQKKLALECVSISKGEIEYVFEMYSDENSFEANVWSFLDYFLGTKKIQICLIPLRIYSFAKHFAWKTIISYEKVAL